MRRLQRMDVVVRRLTAPLAVPDYTAYGRAPRAATLPAGTYVVSMDQRQKHWVQAMLNEDTYVPFPYFYDVTAWSQPLLYDVGGGYSGAPLAMATAAVGPWPSRACPPCRRPAVDRAVLHVADTSRAASSRRAGCAGCSTAGAWRTRT